MRVERLIKPIVFALSLLPLAWLAWRTFTGDLGANPIETYNRFLGDWALRFLLIALAVTPARRLTGWARIGALRRMLGLFAFFYVCLHISSYVVLDHFFDWQSIGKDILKRRYITVGMIALALLVPLAITSTNAMIKRLGGLRWRRLHSVVYLIAPLAVFHFYWMVKADHSRPLFYGGLVALLLGYRIVHKLLGNPPGPRRPRPVPVPPGVDRPV